MNGAQTAHSKCEAKETAAREQAAKNCKTKVSAYRFDVVIIVQGMRGWGHHFPSGQCSVPIAILLSKGLVAVPTWQPQILQRP